MMLRAPAWDIDIDLNESDRETHYKLLSTGGKFIVPASSVETAIERLRKTLAELYDAPSVRITSVTRNHRDIIL